MLIATGSLRWNGTVNVFWVMNLELSPFACVFSNYLTNFLAKKNWGSPDFLRRCAHFLIWIWSPIWGMSFLSRPFSTTKVRMRSFSPMSFRVEWSLLQKILLVWAVSFEICEYDEAWNSYKILNQIWGVTIFLIVKKWTVGNQYKGSAFWLYI